MSMNKPFLIDEYTSGAQYIERMSSVLDRLLPFLKQFLFDLGEIRIDGIFKTELGFQCYLITKYGDAAVLTDNSGSIYVEYCNETFSFNLVYNEASKNVTLLECENRQSGILVKTNKFFCDDNLRIYKVTSETFMATDKKLQEYDDKLVLNRCGKKADFISHKVIYNTLEDWLAINSNFKYCVTIDLDDADNLRVKIGLEDISHLYRGIKGKNLVLRVYNLLFGNLVDTVSRDITFLDNKAFSVLAFNRFLDIENSLIGKSSRKLTSEEYTVFQEILRSKFSLNPDWEFTSYYDAIDSYREYTRELSIFKKLNL